MSDLLDIQGKLQDTAAMLAQLERDFARRPGSLGVQLNIESLEKRKQKLEAELSSATAALGLEVCSYRLLPSQNRAKLSGVTGALGQYQSLLSLFYDAIRNGPKQTAKVSADAAAHTALDLAYVFTGSIGFVLTVPNETTLFDNTTIDESIRLTFEIPKATRPEDILTFARKLGPAPIRAVYKWADAHVKGLLGADIEWRRGERMRQRGLIQWQEFERLQRTILETSDEISENFSVIGELVGTDVTKKTFHLRPGDGGDIRGSSGDVISQSRSVEVPRLYKAKIRKTTKIHYSTEQEDVSYELLELDLVAEPLHSSQSRGS